MLRLVLSSLRANSRRLISTSDRGVPRRRPARRHDGARRHAEVELRPTCSSRRSATPTRWSAAPTPSTPTESSPRTSSTARSPTSSPTIDGVAAVAPQIVGLRPAHRCRRREARRERPAHAGRQLDRGPRAQPLRAGGGSGAGGAARGRHQPRRGRRRRPVDRRHHDGRHARAGRGHHRRASPPSAARTASARPRTPRSHWPAPSSTSPAVPAR